MVCGLQGGESVALARLKYYLWDSDLIANYFNIRNGMLGGDYSTKLSPWLAHGCISPRTIYQVSSKSEKSHVCRPPKIAKNAFACFRQFDLTLGALRPEYTLSITYFWCWGILLKCVMIERLLMQSNISTGISLGLNFRYKYRVQEIKKYESKRTENKSTYWVIFELLWYDVGI